MVFFVSFFFPADDHRGEQCAEWIFCAYCADFVHISQFSAKDMHTFWVQFKEEISLDFGGFAMG